MHQHLDAAQGVRNRISTWEIHLTRQPRRRISPGSGAAVSRGRRAVGVAQHGVEGAGEVVGQRAAVVVLGQRHQAGQNQQHQEEQVEREGGAQHPVEEGPVRGRIPLFLPEWGRRGRAGWEVHQHIGKTVSPALHSFTFTVFVFFKLALKYQGHCRVQWTGFWSLFYYENLKMKMQSDT